MLDDERVESDLEIRRQRNIEEKNAFLANLMNDPFFADAIKDLKDLKEESERNSVNRTQRSKVTAKRKRGDSTFKFSGKIPLERRISPRLQKKKPDYTHLDLPDEKLISRHSDNLDDLEEVVYQVKRARKSSSRNIIPAQIIPVDEVTEEMIQNIQTSGIKVYGDKGTSCHQCRQKTLDTKTICRSGFCIGVRGQFCGICVINRYGEDPVKALKDANWKCYVCRGCCNCSFCRAKEGKRPTGILAPLAKMNGFKSVMEFLQNLNGYGDYEEPQKNPENFVGFEGDEAVFGCNKREKMSHCFVCQAMTLKTEIVNEKELSNSINSEDLEALLGFVDNVAVLGNNKRIEIKTDYDLQ